MPDITSQELIVTDYVYDTFTGDSFTSYDYGDARYYTFESRPNERWVDTDRDGWWDYGVRNVQGGEWWTFDGFAWRNSRGEIMETLDENSFSAGQTSFSDGRADDSSLISEFSPVEEANKIGGDGWIF